MEKTPKVSTITLNTNGGKYIIAAIESMLKFDYPNFEIVIVDHGSTDGSCEEIEKKFPQVKLIKAGRNLGFCGGNNLGMKHASGDCFFFISDDMIFHKDLLKVLIAELYSAADIGVVGPKVYYMDEPNRIWFAGGNINWAKFQVSVTGKDVIEGELPNDIKRETDYITGGAFMVKREVVDKVGGFWNIIFIYYDDSEWCSRIKEAGYKIIYIPFGGVWHAKSITTSRFYWADLKDKLKKAPIFVKPIVALRIVNRWLFQYMIRRDFRIYKNRFLFFMRHAPRSYKLKFLLRFIFLETPQFLYLVAKKIIKNIFKRFFTVPYSAK